MTKIVPNQQAYYTVFYQAAGAGSNAAAQSGSAKYRGSGVEGSRLDKRSYTVVHALVFGFLDTTH